MLHYKNLVQADLEFQCWLYAVLDHYFKKVIYYLLLVTATAMKSVTIKYYFILKLILRYAIILQ